MRLVHRPAGRILATDVELADTFFQQARGLMFRRSIPDGYALVFELGEPKTRSLHMVFVPFAIDALWLTDGEVTAKSRLRPFVGFGRGRGDTIVELPAGSAEDVAVGDRVELVA